MDLSKYASDSTITNGAFRMMYLLNEKETMLKRDLCDCMSLSLNQINLLLDQLKDRGLVDVERKEGYGVVCFISLKE